MKGTQTNQGVIQNMQYVATLRVDGRPHHITSKDMPEWMAKKQIQLLVKELRSHGKNVNLIEVKQIDDGLFEQGMDIDSFSG